MSAPAPHPSQKNPRDAATLVIVDRQSGEPRLLLGKRRADQVFLPGKYVFPGGGVDPEDRLVNVAGDLDEREVAKLLLAIKGTPAAWRPRGLALAALRETFEETGLVFGRKADRAALDLARPPPSWARFLALGYLPDLSPLSLIARAITPPGRPRRYDTRFFLVDARHIASRDGTIDGELDRLDWFSIEESRGLDLPSITRAVIEDLADLLALDEGRRREQPVPFYFLRNGTFHRDLLRPA